MEFFGGFRFSIELTLSKRRGTMFCVSHFNKQLEATRTLQTLYFGSFEGHKIYHSRQ